MKVEIIPCLKDNYSYVVIDERNNKTCVVDPSESKPIINFLEKNNLKLNYILNTHHHYDHVGGNSELKKKYKAKVGGFKEDYKRIPEIDIKLKDGTDRSVLFSPAAASFDQFKNFEKRGQEFKNL